MNKLAEKHKNINCNTLQYNNNLGKYPSREVADKCLTQKGSAISIIMAIVDTAFKEYFLRLSGSISWV